MRNLSLCIDCRVNHLKIHLEHFIREWPFMFGTGINRDFQVLVHYVNLLSQLLYGKKFVGCGAQ